MPNVPQSSSDSTEVQPNPAEMQSAAPSAAEASGAPLEGESSLEALEPLPPAESSRSQFRETLGRAREAIGNVRNVVLGTESTGGELKKVVTAAKDVALDVPGTQLKAMGKLLTFHPVEAVKAEAAGLARTAVDVKDFAVSSFRATAKGTGNVVAAPVKLAGLTGRAAVEGARMAGHGIAAAAIAPVHLAAWAGRGVLNAPLRGFNAIMNGLARVHDGIASAAKRTLAMVPGAAPA